MTTADLTDVNQTRQDLFNAIAAHKAAIEENRNAPAEDQENLVVKCAINKNELNEAEQRELTQLRAHFEQAGTTIMSTPAPETESHELQILRYTYDRDMK